MTNKTKTVTATYVWAVTITVKVPDDADDHAQRLALNLALQNADPRKVAPIIHDCSNENLID